MVPVLQQIFAPVANMGAVAGSSDGGAPDPVGPTVGGFEISMAETVAGDAKPMAVIAAIFKMQELPPDPGTELAETVDITAETLLDAGAIFALQQQTLPAAPQRADVPSTIPSIPQIASLPAAQGEDTPALGDAVILPAKPLGENDLLPQATQGPDPTQLPQAKQADKTTKTDAIPASAPQPSAVLPPDSAVPMQIVAPVARAARADQVILAAPETVPSETVPPEASPPETLPSQMTQVVKVLPILPRMTAATLAESMFRTQIDAQDVAQSAPIASPVSAKPPLAPTHAVAVVLGGEILATDPLDTIPTPPLPQLQIIKTVQDKAGRSTSDVAVDTETTDAGMRANAVVAADFVQTLIQDVGGDGQPIPAKSEVAPLQSAQTPVAAPLPHLPTTPAHLAAQILPHSHAAKTGPIEVLLNPAELGHLRFEIHQKGEHVQVVLTAERPETLDLLRRNGDQLALEFRNAGFSGASLSFGQWGRSSDGQPPASFIASAEDDIGPVVLAPVAKPPMPQDNSRNLNLRL